MNRCRAAYLGPPGTFSHEAAVLAFQPGCELVPGATADEVIRLYRQGAADRAIVAVDSSIGGTVGANLDAIARLDRVWISGEILLPVHHQLAARPPAGIPAIRTVLAHPKAFEECARWLARNLPDAARIAVPSSAAAAARAEADRTGAAAAIVSRTAADLYRMKILAADIESSPLNTTRFWILGTETPPPTGRDNTILLVGEKLNAALAGLLNAQIRIRSIYERPCGGRIEERLYFLEMEGHGCTPPLSPLLPQLAQGRWLGSYPVPETGFINPAAASTGCC